MDIPRPSRRARVAGRRSPPARRKPPARPAGSTVPQGRIRTRARIVGTSGLWYLSRHSFSVLAALYLRIDTAEFWAAIMRGSSAACEQSRRGLPGGTPAPRFGRCRFWCRLTIGNHRKALRRAATGFHASERIHSDAPVTPRPRRPPRSAFRADNVGSNPAGDSLTSPVLAHGRTPPRGCPPRGGRVKRCRS